MKSCGERQKWGGVGVVRGILHMTSILVLMLVPDFFSLCYWGEGVRCFGLG